MTTNESDLQGRLDFEMDATGAQIIKLATILEAAQEQGFQKWCTGALCQKVNVARCCVCGSNYRRKDITLMFEKPRVSASLAQQPNRIKEIKCLVERTSADLTWKIRKCELVRQTC